MLTREQLDKVKEILVDVVESESTSKKVKAVQVLIKHAELALVGEEVPNWRDKNVIYTSRISEVRSGKVLEEINKVISLEEAEGRKCRIIVTTV